MSAFEIIILAIIYIFCYSYLCASTIDEKDNRLIILLLLTFIVTAPIAIINIAMNLYIKLNK